MSKLTDFLEKNKDDKGLMTLRRALVSSREARAWPVLAVFDGIGREHNAQVIRTIAGLFAIWHDFPPIGRDSGSIGSVCRMLCSSDEDPSMAEDDDHRPVKPTPMEAFFLFN